LRGARAIQESSAARARWMSLTETAASVDTKEDGANYTIEWARRQVSGNPGELANIYNWAVSLPLAQSEWDKELSRPLSWEPPLVVPGKSSPPSRPLAYVMDCLVSGVGRQEPAFSQWLSALPAEQAPKIRPLILAALFRQPEKERLKVAQVLNDPLLLRELRKSL
jgi:hypothetical protein